MVFQENQERAVYDCLPTEIPRQCKVFYKHIFYVGGFVIHVSDQTEVSLSSRLVVPQHHSVVCFPVHTKQLCTVPRFPDEFWEHLMDLIPRDNPGERQEEASIVNHFSQTIKQHL